MKEWICEEIPAVKLNGEVVSTMLHQTQELIRCKECWKKENPYECMLDSDLEEHGGHRTEKYDDWFCADGERKDV